MSTEPPKITIHQAGAETPSQAVARAAKTTVTKVDKRGRRITVRRFNALQFFRLSKILGDSGGGPATLNMAMAAASVCAIDDEEEMFPNTSRELDAIIQRLDFEGLAAAGEAMEELGEEKGLDSAKN